MLYLQPKRASRTSDRKSKYADKQGRILRWTVVFRGIFLSLKILPQVEDWQKRTLSEIYLVLYIDAIHYSVRDNGVIRKLAAYVILEINIDGQKEILTDDV